MSSAPIAPCISSILNVCRLYDGKVIGQLLASHCLPELAIGRPRIPGIPCVCVDWNRTLDLLVAVCLSVHVLNAKALIVYTQTIAN